MVACPPLALLAAALLPAAAWPQGEAFHLPDATPAVSDKIASYEIDVELLEDGATIRGELVATWRNPSPLPVSELHWHVYNNAWSGPESLFLTEQRWLGRSSEPRAWGKTEIGEVQLLGGFEPPVALKPDWPAPDEAPGDRTVMVVPLPAVVPSNESVRVRVPFRAQLPPAYRRSGTDGEGGYLHAAQWFPKLGVFEENQGQWGWNCEPYHALTEFYADYGDYRLQLTLPPRYRDKVAATGTLAGSEELEDGRLRLRFHAEDVHDFAWTADPDFVVVERIFEPAEWADPAEEIRVASALGRAVETVRPRPTRILLYLQPEHRAAEERYLEAAAKALWYFQLWFGPYPYETLSIVDPAHNARATGGMEYPRLITGGARRGSHARSLSPEGVTVHEFGHQYWYGLVGNDEFHHAWMDEGFNTWSTNRVLRRGWKPPLNTYRLLGVDRAGRAPAEPPSYGPGDPRALFTLLRWETPDLDFVPALSFELRRRTPLERWLQELPPLTYWNEVENDRVWGQRRVVGEDWSDALARSTHDLLSGGMRSVNAYYRPALTLETMAGLMGEVRWTRVMRAYSERFRFRHPRPEDFLAVVNEFGAGASLGDVPLDWPAFWRQAYHQNRSLDFGVHRLANLPASSPEGGPWDVVLEIRRYGDFELPVEVRLIWSDGETSDWVWPGDEPWARYHWASQPRRAVAVEIDPDRRLLLDRDWLNNSRRVEPEPERAWQAGLRTLIWAQQVLHHAGGQG